ncbi:MAG: UTP--glucose-1-phosphate uridylyltransferase [Alphaproteobacteria bacterium]|nr:UTP--glucose-1-phosphate uridylyltransferase [Alphaproteobacteria bacterium]
MKPRHVRRAIIPAGALGTRFLPATKALPTEMLPLVDRPLVQYAVDEALAAGIEKIVVVTGRGKAAIEDHFDCARELEDTLRRHGKRGALQAVEDSCARPGVIAYMRQQQPLGLAHALWCARHVIGDEPFAVLAPDDVILAKVPCLVQMVAAYREIGDNLVAVTPLARSGTARNGAIAATARNGRLLTASGIAAQPASAGLASKWAVAGRYILDSAILRRLGERPPNPDGDVPFIDALARLAGDGALRGYAFAGRHFDCSDVPGLLEANIAFALDRTDLAPTVRHVLSRYARLVGHTVDHTGRPRPVETPEMAVPA